MGTSSGSLAIAQVAFVADRVGVHETSDWYQEVFGFLPAGWTDRFGGPDIARLQDLSDPDPKLKMAWLVDQNDAFQLELFEYERPKSRPRRADWSPRDIGYSLVTLFVIAFDRTLQRAIAKNALIGHPSGATGHRRALIADPNGILLELLEEDVRATDSRPPARPEVEVAIRSISASVPNLAKSVTFFGTVLGLAAVDDVVLHGPEHWAMWGLEGADRISRVFVAGDVFLELVEYRNPRGNPWPTDYQLSDGGVMNIALATTSKQLYSRIRSRIGAGNFECRDLVPGDEVVCSYATDDQGFSVELLFMAPAAYADFGFVPLAATERAG